MLVTGLIQANSYRRTSDPPSNAVVRRMTAVAPGLVASQRIRICRSPRTSGTRAFRSIQGEVARVWTDSDGMLHMGMGSSRSNTPRNIFPS